MTRLVLFLCLIPTLVFGASVELMWNHNTEPDLTHYTAYYGNYSGNTKTFPSRGNVVIPAGTNTVIIPNLSSTEKWFFRVTASNATHESLYSNFVSVQFIRTPSNLKFQKVEIR